MSVAPSSTPEIEEGVQYNDYHAYGAVADLMS